MGKPVRPAAAAATVPPTPHSPTLVPWLLQGAAFGEWLQASGIQAGEQLQLKAEGGDVLIRRGPMAPQVGSGGLLQRLPRPPVHQFACSGSSSCLGRHTDKFLRTPG